MRAQDIILPNADGTDTESQLAFQHAIPEWTERLPFEVLVRIQVLKELAEKIHAKRPTPAHTRVEISKMVVHDMPTSLFKEKPNVVSMH